MNKKVNAVLGLVFVGLNALDCSLTAHIVGEAGTGSELSISIRNMIDVSMSYVWGFKILGSAILAGALYLLSAKYHEHVTRILVVLNIGMLLIVLWNTYQWMTIQ
jgi:hypothetical protein